ncbi:kinase-like protein [Microthyrium microscopicum]|uniref:Kinase-like protein n=1 Tax=Microthyrium microscopicum TaxID=703497 RepID=A0A6A6UGD7_9PEZI|nr:kinase-like protein [Microthyrium microscopicum]
MGNSQGKPVVFTDQVNLNHFRLLRVVGKGAFGKVRIVERKDTACTFALKYIRKDEVVRSESVRNIIRERRMLEHLNHPFLCNLRYSFQDIEYLYLVVDLMTGGDLRFHISRKAFTEDAVRFWMAELGCALRYIHTQGIVHRDVKPDNILLDADGHVHLADFNVASDFKPNKPLTSKSGTLAYLAPEVYDGKGYSCEVDWWSLGVCFYECIYNKRPFDASSHEGLARKIREANPAFPMTNPPVSNPCLHAISSFLERDKTQRIGASGFSTFTDNPFFRSIDFDALLRKEIEPVFKPSSEKTNFDATYDLEELLLEEAPLEARARRQKPREQLKDDATTAEIRADELHRMIEKLFEPFDYTHAQFDKQRISDTTDPTLTSAASGSANETSSPIDVKSNSRNDHAFSNNSSMPSPQSQQGHDDGQSTNLSAQRTKSTAISTQATPNGSPPLPIMEIPLTNKSPQHTNQPPRSVPQDYILDADSQGLNRQRSNSRSGSKSRRFARNKRAQQLADASAMDDDDPPYTAGGLDPVHHSLPTTGLEDKKPSGMLAFLSRKKGRERSPKARERGVLGKEGARAIVGP